MVNAFPTVHCTAKPENFTDAKASIFWFFFVWHSTKTYHRVLVRQVQSNPSHRHLGPSQQNVPVFDHNGSMRTEAK